jgi:hypothetical protein
MVFPPFIPCPATGDAFIGRQGLVKNLRDRMAQGESLAVIGGPKLGKTSLVRTASQALTSRMVLETDLGANPAASLDVVPGSIVILDNLDSLAESAIEPLLTRVRTAKPSSIVVTGGRCLRAMLGDSGTSVSASFRAFPLSVLLDGEMRRLTGPAISPDVGACAGNHPYLTKLLLYYMDAQGSRRTLEDAVAMGRGQWEPFAQRLAAEIGHGSERRLLCYLIERGQPVNPAQAQTDTGIRDLKAVADTLAWLGVISRWIRNEEATLFAGCRLFNDFIAAEANKSCPAS